MGRRVEGWMKRTLAESADAPKTGQQEGIDVLVIQVEQELVVQAFDVLIWRHNRLQILILELQLVPDPCWG